MTARWQRTIAGLAALALLAAILLPLSSDGPENRLPANSALLTLTFSAALLFLCAGWMTSPAAIGLGLAGVLLGCGEALLLLGKPGIAGQAGPAFWALVIGTWLAAGLCVTRLAAIKPTRPAARRALDLLVPLLFGAFVLYLWEVAVRGFGVPAVLMPAPSAIMARLAGSLPVLGEDFIQTFVRGVLTGYAIGCSAGLIVAILAHRFAFLGRGLLPLGNFISALPIVGIAPIMVMWFGFDWPSKAAVVAVITFFPMLVNALAGLSAAGAIERDLMRSYGSTYRQTLTRLYLPAAMPFIFNAMKINSTLALIGAIVAEFFGTPTRGMGFRISIEVARMSLDMVWAEITLAALAGMAFYGVVALVERATTFWHPSYRT
ncbi:ABC transporter permease [Bradyrhizobium prioriisuperbiae]|uniref:ABC transporter permease n=1 Tax=Bradyrhizobium prioriisuperbiae TaxID=2854389 RepID=UPI0028E2C12A|nr:ABC transporter permease [Bradyrhizobium prioritasuperba]